jgi:hypothetical protein
MVSRVGYPTNRSKLAAQDFANPLTRYAMQEYPEDGQMYMSQVHHGSKMLEDLPDGLAPPCVRVNRAVYFVDELLQRSTGGYFIPKKFFQARMSPEGPSTEPTILALGHKVSETGVCPCSRCIKYHPLIPLVTGGICG